MPTNVSLATKCRVEAEAEGIKMHKSIITMLTETLESSKLKQNEDILDFHEKNLKDIGSKQQEYNHIIAEVHEKLQENPVIVNKEIDFPNLNRTDQELNQDSPHESGK